MTISVDGTPKATTDENGVYYLTFDNLPGSFEILAEKDTLYFDPITVRVDENLRQMPDI